MAGMASWDYSGATAYAVWAVVQYNGSVWRCSVSASPTNSTVAPGIGGDGYTWVNLESTVWDTNGTNMPAIPPGPPSPVGGFAANAAPSSTVLNWILWQVSQWTLWLSGLLNYANTWLQTQTFSASISSTGGAGVMGVEANGGTGNAIGVQGTGTGTQPGVVGRNIVGTGAGGLFTGGAGNAPGIIAYGGGNLQGVVGTGGAGATGVIGQGGAPGGFGVSGIADAGGAGVNGLSVSGPGVQASGNATRGPIAMGTLGAAPTAADALAGDMYVGGGHLYVCLANGVWTLVI